MELNIEGPGSTATVPSLVNSEKPKREQREKMGGHQFLDTGKADKHSKSIGLKRARSKATGERESTPDQEDLQPVAAQDEEFDVNSVLQITMSREAKLKEELDVITKNVNNESDEDGPELAYESDRDEGYISFAGQATFSMHSRKEAKKSRRPKFERSDDAVVHTGSLTRAGNAEEAGIGQTTGGFASLGVSELLCAHLEKQGFTSPTPVQSKSIPSLIQGKDVMIESATGTGKTLTYLIPIFETLSTIKPNIQRSDGTQALILCPTRELCLQVLDIATILSRRFAWIVPGSIHGGENRSKEKARLRKGLNVLISTPGRLFDHLMNTASFKFSQIRWVVLDEADRLLDMGFKKQIANILSALRSKSELNQRWQTALLSATLQGAQDLVALSMQNPIAIRASESNGDSKSSDIFSEIPKKLRQNYMVVPCKFRLVTLFAALKKHMSREGTAKVLIFLSNCDSVDYHQILLQNQWKNIPSVIEDNHEAPSIIKLHGNMSQIERTRSLLSFTKSLRGILLATDVASRGLDFPEISMIIQYDAPASPEEYVHRVGRTARFGKEGEALLFVLPAECGFISYLHSTCGLMSLQKNDTPTLLNHSYGVDAKAGKSLALELHRGANHASHHLKTAVSQDRDLTKLGEMAFTSSVRAYATHSHELKEFFRIKALHLGHYANSLALKETPIVAGKHGSSMSHKGNSGNRTHKGSSRLPEIEGFNRKTGRKVKQPQRPQKKRSTASQGYVLS
jgi:ATP-dependent RNA helicase DDX31/DBP7